MTASSMCSTKLSLFSTRLTPLRLSSSVCSSKAASTARSSFFSIPPVCHSCRYRLMKLSFERPAAASEISFSRSVPGGCPAAHAGAGGIKIKSSSKRNSAGIPCRIRDSFIQLPPPVLRLCDNARELKAQAQQIREHHPAVSSADCTETGSCEAAGGHRQPRCR